MKHLLLTTIAAMTMSFGQALGQVRLFLKAKKKLLPSSANTAARRVKN